MLPNDTRRYKPSFTRLCRNKPTCEHGPMFPLQIRLRNSTLRRVIRRLHVPLEIMLVCVRWCAAYPRVCDIWKK